MSFVMTQVPRAPEPFRGLDLTWQTEPGHVRVGGVHWALGADEIPYGSLTAYLLRRFGYPERSWDPDKDLVGYTLSTPDPHLLLRVIPYVGGRADISINPMVDWKTAEAIRAWEDRDEALWLARLDAFVAGKGPAPGWTSEAKTELARKSLLPGTDVSDGALAFRLAIFQRYRPQTAREEWRHWGEELVTAFEAEAGPRPILCLRAPEPEAWAEDDPLKPLALALRTALQDLCQPVRVRDMAIGPFGEIDTDELDEDAWILEPHPATGYPLGALGQSDPRGLCDLHELVHQLGGGDAKAGIQSAIAALQAALEATQTPSTDAVPAP